VIGVAVAVALLMKSDDGDSAADAASPTATPGPTGVSDVDRVIAGLASGDAATIDSLLQFTKVKCVAVPPQALAPPPTCPSGVADGTPVDAMIIGNCQGVWVLEAQRSFLVDEVIRISKAVPDLYAVIYPLPPSPPVPDNQGVPPVVYAAVYGQVDVSTGWSVNIDRGITNVFEGCVRPPETIAQRRDTTKGTDGYLLPPTP